MLLLDGVRIQLFAFESDATVLRQADGFLHRLRGAARVQKMLAGFENTTFSNHSIKLVTSKVYI